MPEFEPHTRNEALLNAIANGQESTIVPQSRNEFLLSEISKKQVPEFTPHTRNEALLMEVARTVAEGGGGNPNRVQTVTGTLAQPFGDYDLYESLLDAITNGNASAQLEFVFNDVPQKLPIVPNVGTSGLTGSATQIYEQAYGASRVLWTPDQDGYGIAFAYMVGTETGNQIVDISSMAPGISSTLTIIWHPLPDG